MQMRGLIIIDIIKIWPCATTGFQSSSMEQIFMRWQNISTRSKMLKKMKDDELCIATVLRRAEWLPRTGTEKDTQENFNPEVFLSKMTTYLSVHQQ